MPFCSVLPYRAAVLADETASAEVVHGFASAVARELVLWNIDFFIYILSMEISYMVGTSNLGSWDGLVSIGNNWE